MYMKKKLIGIFALISIFTLASCDNENEIINNNDANNVVDNSSNEENNNQQNNSNNNSNEENNNQQNDSNNNSSSESNNDNNLNGEDNNENNQNNETPEKLYNATPKIYLAGDSTVQTYNVSQYIAGWGQYLGLYLPNEIVVSNAARGGRSSRSFINEGRLYDTKENNFSYTFSENGGKSIESQIENGDFLFIQFGHNDDDTKDQGIDMQYQRFVPLGTPDANGIYPTISPTNKQSTSNLDSNLSSSTKSEIAKYGENYFAYDATGLSGTYKGYLKEYIDLARKKDAIPVLITPVARVKFQGNTIVGGPGLHGDNFAYVEAVRQLAEEEDCLLIDLFDYTKNLLEVATPSYSNFVMALKPNTLTGEWPAGYDSTYMNFDLGYEGIEATHYNKYGAFLTAAKIAEVIKTTTEEHNNGKELFTFRDLIKTDPTSYVAPSNLISKEKIEAIEKTITYVNVKDPQRIYPTNDELVAKLAQIPDVDLINEENYEEISSLLDEAKILYSILNVDDREAEFKIKIDETDAKIQEIIISLRPVATETYSYDLSNLSSLADISSDFVINDANNKFSVSGKCLKFGGNGSTTSENLSYSINGTGKILITVKAYSGDVSKQCNLSVSDGTNTKTLAVTEGTSQTLEYEFKIDGSTTYYFYRASGSQTGVLISSITFEYFEN